ncbi:hypothetical protein HK101_011113 [Irineochytrium annulatum]|nr:hypothetical protein HK101_011113 [Irineochytrium annulatum]
MQDIRRAFAGVRRHDTKDLHIFLTEEKDVIKCLQALTKEKRDAIKYLGVWGKMEHADIDDISSKLTGVMSALVDGEDALIESMTSYRSKLAEIRKREEAITQQKAKVKRTVAAVREAAKKQKDVEQATFEQDLAEEELRKMESESEGLKRLDMRDAFRILFAGYAELARKMAAVATFGTHLADQIPQGTLLPGQVLPPFNNANVTDQIMADFNAALKGQPPESILSLNRGSSSPTSADATMILTGPAGDQSPVPPPKNHLVNRTSNTSITHDAPRPPSASPTALTPSNSLPMSENDHNDSGSTTAGSFIATYATAERRSVVEYTTISRPNYDRAASEVNGELPPPPASPYGQPYQHQNQQQQPQQSFQSYQQPFTQPTYQPQQPYGQQQQGSPYYGQPPGAGGGYYGTPQAYYQPHLQQQFPPPQPIEGQYGYRPPYQVPGAEPTPPS